jgi:hypothetical protein
MGSIVAADISFRLNGEPYSLIKDFIKLFLYKEIILPDAPTYKILYSMGNYNNRQDYIGILNYVRRSANGEFIDLNKSKFKLSKESFKNFYSALNFFIKGCIKISIIFRLVHYLNTLRELERQSSLAKNYNKYCSFCSSQPYEGLIDRYFSSLNIPTLTLQHALYFVHTKPIIYSLVYENMISDKLLCWGGYTKDQFLNFGIKSERLCIAGYPKPTKFLRPYKIKPCNLKIIVFCGAHLYDENNMVMLKTILNFINMNETYQVSISVKLHPSLQLNKYQAICEEYGFSINSSNLEDLLSLNAYDFAIAYNTTAYYDSYLNNCIALHFHDADRENGESVLEDSFSNSWELANKVKYFMSVSNDSEIWDEIKSRLSYLVGYEINRYVEYLRVE